MGTEVIVPHIPKCDICKHKGIDPCPDAVVDGAMTQGSWAYMCQECFMRYGVGLGTGRGQKLVVIG